MPDISREKQQKILDILGELLSRQYGYDITFTLKDKDPEDKQA